MPASATSALGFWRSCLATGVADGALHSLDALRHWIESQRRAATMRVSRIPFAEMDAWSFTRDAPLRLAHASGRFFTVEGARFRVLATGQTWDQPMLNQPEVGLLGFLMSVFDGVPHFLAQAKREPGNAALQLSPTVQATYSNYTRAHGGREQPYLDHFISPHLESIAFDVLMPEHGGYFLRKRNRNMVVRVSGSIPVRDGFCWVTLGQLKALLGEDDVVHMDSRSVLACLPLGASGAADELAHMAQDDDHAAAIARSASASEDVTELEAWLEGTPIDVELLSLDGLRSWPLEADLLGPGRGASGDFSIVAVRVEASHREIPRWTQPMVAPAMEGFLGQIVTRRAGTTLFLVEARPQAGHDGSAHVFPTVSTTTPDEAPFVRHFRDGAEGKPLLSVRNSEEGGRFFHFYNRYRVTELPPETLGVVPTTHRWVSLAQLAALAQRGLVSMELRNLLAALPVAARR